MSSFPRLFPSLDGVIGYDDGSFFLIAPFDQGIGFHAYKARIYSIPKYGAQNTAKPKYVATISKQP